MVMDSDEFSSISSSSFPSSYASKYRRSASDSGRSPWWKTALMVLNTVVSLMVIAYFVWVFLLKKGNTRLLHFLEKLLKDKDGDQYNNYLDLEKDVGDKDIPGKPKKGGEKK